MPRTREQRIYDYRFSRTVCGLLGFIVFFMGSLNCFILADESGEYYATVFLAGFVMLAITAMFFCCVLHESKRVDEPLLVRLEREALLHQQEQEPLLQPEPDQVSPQDPRPDQKISEQIAQILAGDSVEVTNFEFDSDVDTKALLAMAKSGKPPTDESPIAGTSKDYMDTARNEDVGDFMKPGPSRIAGQSSMDIESKYDDIPLIDMSMSALSLSSPLSDATASGEMETKVSAALSRLSLDSVNMQAVKETVTGLFTNLERKSDEQSKHTENGSKAKEVDSSKLESKKQA